MEMKVWGWYGLQIENPQCLPPPLCCQHNAGGIHSEQD